MAINRKPTAAGRFYPFFKKDLNKTIQKCFLDAKFGPGQELTIQEKSDNYARTILGGICPHAGYIYSGSALAHTIQQTFGNGLPDTVIILGTSHTGYQKVGLMKHGTWETPLGKIEIDTELAQAILDESPNIIEDDGAFNGYPHGGEHNIEVQIPFLQYAAQKRKQEIKIIPIKIGVMQPKQLENIATTISKAIVKVPEKDIVVLASSDMTHFRPQNPYNPKEEIEHVQKVRDQAVIDAFQEFDWQKTITKARETTVCGPQTITTLMIVAKNLGFGQSEPLKYYTSYEKHGESTPCDYSVGYFAGIFKK